MKQFNRKARECIYIYGQNVIGFKLIHSFIWVLKCVKTGDKEPVSYDNRNSNCIENKLCSIQA